MGNRKGNFKLNAKQKLFVDKYFQYNFDAPKAYYEVYDVKTYSHAKQLSWRLLNDPRFIRVQEYVEYKQEQLSKHYDVTRQTLIRDMVDLKNTYEEMIYLASIDKPNEEQTAKLKRLGIILKASDVTRTNEQLAKLLGLNEPDKHNINLDDYTITFGGLIVDDKNDEKDEKTD